MACAGKQCAYMLDTSAEQSSCPPPAVCDRLGQVAAFIMESGLSVGGVVLPPTGYLQAVYAAVRAAGGVCIADEVQACCQSVPDSVKMLFFKKNRDAF